MPLAFYQNILPKKLTLLSVNAVDFANIFDSCFLFDLIDWKWMLTKNYPGDYYTGTSCLVYLYLRHLFYGMQTFYERRKTGTLLYGC